MHIPDGYLSPSTCAVLYAASTPFWWIALKRTQASLNARFVPLISLVSAFCFVIMLFNIPLPGGTTGHAAGMAVSTIVLGPWASILAVSVALAIQAIFFGDGGITSYGANCFNMAIVGSLAGYLFYRLISGNAALTSSRRVVAAAVAGYVAINLAALCAAVEFGIQPALFHDASGSPLYAPYPLSIAIPAMLIGHLSFAGLAELVLSAGVVAYLQKHEPDLLKATAIEAFGSCQKGLSLQPLRRLWIGMALLMLLTPLGLLATGTAWGEWAAADFKNPATRTEIAAASHQIAPPTNPPSGMERLASVWTAPFPDYAPAIIKNPNLGYILSAMFGCGLILLLSLLVGRLGIALAKRSE